MKTFSALIQAGLLLISLLLSGCGGEEFVYEQPNELKPGPGLFSGQDGEFTLLGVPEEEMKAPEKKEKKE